MVKHEIIQCPRCQALFECKLGSVTICHCSDVHLTRGQREMLAQRWQSCLCHACLQAVARGEE
ncbi:MAG: cysteine-rich CWC family protein [Porticoccaceae bacterium]